MSKTILVTGAAGFIGFHLCKSLLEEGYKIIGLDNLNDYYDVKLKEKRLKVISEKVSENKSSWHFTKTDIKNNDDLIKVFEDFKPEIVVNLAAQAGVRYSLINPTSYINSNIVGFLNILECCKKFKIKNLLYASSSSVYGGNSKIPFSEQDSVNHPVSLYAATKRSNELMAHTYSHLYNLKATGMRFFTVYGPWGRPDMAPMIFAESILSKKPIKVFNYGKMSRSFTYIDDVIKAIKKLILKPATPDKNFSPDNPNPSTSWCPHRIFNIGNKNSINLQEFIITLEKELNIKATKKYLPIQPGDVEETLSENSLIESWCGNINETSVSVGVKKFIKWYKSYHFENQEKQRS